MRKEPVIAADNDHIVFKSKIRRLLAKHYVRCAHQRTHEVRIRLLEAVIVPAIRENCAHHHGQADQHRQDADKKQDLHGLAPDVGAGAGAA